MFLPRWKISRQIEIRIILLVRARYMKKILYLLTLIPAIAVVFVAFEYKDRIWGQGTAEKAAPKAVTQPAARNYAFPEFYRGIYLTVDSGRNADKLSGFINRAKASRINTIVVDVQYPRSGHCAIPASNVKMMLDNGIHPVARIVVFPDGLKSYPANQDYIQERITIAREACENGFREIQFDYIRFNDYSVTGRPTVMQRYEYIESILRNAKNTLRQYNVRIAADIFGRIPLNKVDPIGQRMEGLDKVVDVICPMAYPSHYTWSKALMANPYQTVLITSQKAKERTSQAHIVPYIQAFQMKVKMSGLSYDQYVTRQIKAVHDAGVRGFILWNARQDYEVPLYAVKTYYSSNPAHLSPVFPAAQPAQATEPPQPMRSTQSKNNQITKESSI